jgi:membrane protease YdiL (CAAX protease family)
VRAVTGRQCKSVRLKLRHDLIVAGRQPILASIRERRNHHGIIKLPSADAILPSNPYRSILRREYPEPLIALLAFILGIWLWDHYFGKSEGYPPGTEQVAMLKIDRDLRLADAMVGTPQWFRWLVAVDEPAVVQLNALEVFEKLTREKAISGRGLEAYTIIKAEQTVGQRQEAWSGILQRKESGELQQIAQNLAQHFGTWWQAKLLEKSQANAPLNADWRESFAADSSRLKTRTLWARGGVWLLGLLGLGCVPLTLLYFRRNLPKKPRGYGGAWPLSMGLMIFLVATLAWIGFSMTLEFGIDRIVNLSPLMGILIDSAARLLPALIAIGLIFRRPSHAWRVLGMQVPLAVGPILGLFSLLLILDQGLRVIFDQITANIPGGGLSIGDSGLWGLAFSVVSACLLAPIVEETLYRGVLFRSLWNRLGIVPGALLSSIIFALVHFYDGYGLFSVGLFGFTSALLYAASGSLRTVILFHLLYNTAIKLPEWIVYHASLG